MSTLVIVESPSKIKSVGKYLGAGYTVTASVGHIRDLPKSEKKAIDIEAGFVPHYEISPTKKKVVMDLISLARKSDQIFIATDPDREGEAIGWHVAECISHALGTKTPPIKRITFTEITADAVRAAASSPREIDQDLRRAQEARRVLDRLMGYDLSGLIWKKIRYGLSAGRVQSPALRIIMEREREIRAFIPEWYGQIVVHTSPASAKELQLPLACTTDFKDKPLWESVCKQSETHNWKVDAIDISEQKRNPRAPLTTSTLQQTASTRLGFAPGRTMRAAQKLYEQGHITYMRTDSTNLSKGAQASIVGWVEKVIGKQYAHWNVYASKSKNAQEAHEAIRPTDISRSEAGLTHDEQSLYRLIWVRAVSSQMIAATVEKTSIQSFLPYNNETYTFQLTGQKIIEPGWMRIDTGARSEDIEVPSLSVGDKLNLESIEPIEKYTTPPNRYSEAGLIKELEKRGIGRPSTYASIIETLIDREYVQREGRTLIPTDTGDVVSSFVEEHFGQYISDSFTAEMEEELDDVAEGQKEYTSVLSHWYWPLHNAVGQKDAELGKANDLGDADSQFVCPECGSSMKVKLGKTGKFLSCSRYPDCMGALAIDGLPVNAANSIGDDPETGLPIYLLSGKFGPYVQLGNPTERDVITTLKSGKEKIKKEIVQPRRASLSPGMKPENVTLEVALKLLSLPRILGTHPDTSVEIIANTGRFGPYVGMGTEFRSLKKDDDPYTISLERALELINTPKTLPKGVTESKEVGIHPKTKKKVIVYKDKKGIFKKLGLRRIYIDTTKDIGELELDDVI